MAQARRQLSWILPGRSLCSASRAAADHGLQGRSRCYSPTRRGGHDIGPAALKENTNDAGACSIAAGRLEQGERGLAACPETRAGILRVALDTQKALGYATVLECRTASRQWSG